MWYEKEDVVEFPDALCLAETDAAIKVRIKGQRFPAWFPKSQVADDSDVKAKNDSGLLIVSEWIANERGLT